MTKHKISSRKLDEKVFVVHFNGDIYTGGTSKTLTNQSTGDVLCKCEKSVRTIASHGDYMCCGSYDCTATLLYRGKVLDVIEGPDTEIKCVAFSEDGKYLAMATRGKAVWVMKIDKGIEIDKILEDHLQDVKGCVFHKDLFFTYGYDNTIKVYDRFDYDESWEMIQSIEEANTVWHVIFHHGKMVCSTEDGVISLYTLRNGWEQTVSRKLSVFPIYSICSIGNRMAYTLNRNSIGIIDENLDFISSIENVHCDFINSICYDEDRNSIVSGGDDGVLCVVSLED